jgi:hypothetical protein
MNLRNFLNATNAVVQGILYNQGQDMNSLTASDSSNNMDEIKTYIKMPSKDHSLLRSKQTSKQEEVTVEEGHDFRNPFNSVDNNNKQEKEVVCTLEAKLRHPKSADAAYEATYKIKRADWLMIENHDNYCHQQLDLGGRTMTNPGSEGWCTYQDMVEEENGNHNDIFTLETIPGITSTFVLSHWYVHPCSKSIDRFNRHNSQFLENIQDSQAAVLTISNKAKDVELSPENGWSHSNEMEKIAKKNNDRSLGHEGKISISVNCDKDCDCSVRGVNVLA